MKALNIRPTRSQFILQAVACFALASLISILAIDTGSLWQYIACIFFAVWGIRLTYLAITFKN